MKHRAFVDSGVVRASDVDRIITFVASTNRKDRHGTIIEQNFDLRNLRKNPVFLLGHRSDDLPIGRIKKIYTERGTGPEGADQTLIDVEFATEDLNPVAAQVERLYRGGYMRAVSIGFRPLKVAQLTDDDRTKLGLGRWGSQYLRSELIEVSAVSVPSNPDAVIKKSLDAGIFEDEDEARAVITGQATVECDREALDAWASETEAEVDAPDVETEGEESTADERITAAVVLREMQAATTQLAEAAELLRGAAKAQRKATEAQDRFTDAVGELTERGLLPDAGSQDKGDDWEFSPEEEARLERMLAGELETEEAQQ